MSEATKIVVLTESELEVLIKHAVGEALKAQNGQAGDKFLTAKELAKILNVADSWCYEQSRIGAIPSRHFGVHLRFSLGEVLEACKKKETPS